MTDQQLDTRSRWGRTRVGGRSRPALAVAAPLGVALSLAIGAARVWSNPDGPHRWLAALLLAFFLAPSLVALAWVLLVDRATIRGAVPRPEEGVEHAWYSRAAVNAFHLTIALLGVGGMVGDWFLPRAVTWTLAAVWLTMAVLTALCYLVERRR